MRPSERRTWKSNDEPSPREKREMIERGEWIEDEEASGSAPLIFRLLAWSALVVIFFAVGYGAMSLAFRWLDSRGPDITSDTAAQVQGSQGTEPQTSPNPGGSGQMTALTPGVTPRQAPPQTQDNIVTVTISIPEGNSFKLRQVRCTGPLPEDTMKQTLAAYMDAMKESKMLSAGAQDLNIFQSGEWLYLNMNGEFLESIKTLGAEKSRIMLTGMVKTMSDNFDPVNRIKFYIEGKEVTDKRPLDLTSPWGIRSS
ncbi:MAG: GerMN domain-containing protein [Synergistaceae bacterium]|jgi:hypothetical protein|nr:GerMN domain-containing protein [Synergistaceae bacterium]